jgi:hypothetical protein
MARGGRHCFLRPVTSVRLREIHHPRSSPLPESHGMRLWYYDRESNGYGGRESLKRRPPTRERGGVGARLALPESRPPVAHKRPGRPVFFLTALHSRPFSLLVTARKRGGAVCPPSLAAFEPWHHGLTQFTRGPPAQSQWPGTTVARLRVSRAESLLSARSFTRTYNALTCPVARCGEKEMNRP